MRLSHKSKGSKLLPHDAAWQIATHKHPRVDEEDGESKGHLLQSGRCLNGSTRRQVAFATKVASCLMTAYSSVMTTWWRRLKCDVWGVKSQGRPRLRQFVSLDWDEVVCDSDDDEDNDDEVCDWATLTSAHDWMVMRPLVDDIRASAGRCQLSGLDLVQWRFRPRTERR